MTDDHGTHAGTHADPDDPGIEAIARANRTIHVAPLDGVRFVRAARARRRRTRTVVGSVLATAAIVAGVAVASAGGSPGRTAGVDAADQSDDPEAQALPDPPAGSTWVGLDGVVVAVPADWAVTDSACGTTSTAGILVISRKPTVDTLVDVCEGSPNRAPARIVVAPLGSGDDLAPLPDPPVPSMCKESLPTQCFLSGAFPREDVLIEADFIGTAAEAVRAVLETTMVLPDGWTTVPTGGEEHLSTRTALLEEAGFVVDTSAILDQADFANRSEPASGAPVRDGATITLIPSSRSR